MKASQVRLSELNTEEELEDAKYEIERDYQNVVGGMRAWKSGYARTGSSDR